MPVNLVKVESVLHDTLIRCLGPNLIPLYHRGEPSERDMEAIRILNELRLELGMKPIANSHPKG